MPAKVTTLHAGKAYGSYVGLLLAMRQKALSAIAMMTEVSVGSSYLLNIIDELHSIKSQIDLIKSTPGIVEFARMVEDDPAYDPLTEYLAITAAMTDVVLEIKNGFPVDGSGYLLGWTFNADGSRNERMFGTVATATLVSKLQALVTTTV